MKIEIKLTGFLYQRIIADLDRPHPFAAERIGFALGRYGSLGEYGSLVLLNGYKSIPDDHYIDDLTVGARIGQAAMTAAMHIVYHGRSAREGIFHVHLHGHCGATGMSRTDQREIPRLIPGFQAVSPKAAHGVVILSRDHGTGWVWLPSHPDPITAERISVIGAPIHIFSTEASR